MTELPAAAPAAPQPERRPQRLAAHGDERIDDWYWLRDRDDPAVLAHLRAENAHTDAVLAPLAPRRELLFTEIRSRVQETDLSAPVPDGPWEYLVRTEEGLAYRRHCRRPRGVTDPAAEEVVLDENALAAGHAYFALGGLAIAPDHRRAAYSTDTSGDERYTLRIRDLATGADLDDEIPDTSYGLAWADDGATLFYVRPDETVRPWQVRRHVVGTDPDRDAVVFEDPDERYFVSVRRTRSGRYVIVDASSKRTGESWYVPTARPALAPRVVLPRREGVEYSTEHHTDGSRDRFLLLTNEDAPGFRVDELPVGAPVSARRALVAHDPGARLEDLDAFAGHLVLSERREGLEHLVVLEPDGARRHVVEMPDPVYSAWVGPNREYDTSTVRFEYTSLVRPLSSYDHDVVTATSTLVKRQEVRGGYDPDAYVSAREWVTASDGTAVPMSIVARRDVAPDGPAPGVLYGYGAYETSVDPTFSVARLCLLDRGVVFAIAHVRGGGELGRAWYEAGRLEHKRNTFDDFVACARHLLDSGRVAPGRLAARGRSAGGLLMGAVTNLAPDLFCAVAAEVPFVDVLTTMQDPSIPLTVTEWEEWGNPVDDPAAYERIRSYSPYDNVAPRAYPDVLATGGLHDSRVQYWEPAKWVARLREQATNSPRVLLRTELEAGHGGPSGRYEAWREEAFVLAFLLDALGVAEDATAVSDDSPAAGPP